MEPSTARVPEAIPDDSRPDRRRRVRYRLHTPVYASFNGPQTGTVLDLSELLDLHEEGFCVQTGPAGLRPEDGANSADRLEVNHPVTICLDLAETHSYMHGSGVVVWRDNAGRTGVRLSFVPEREMAALKEWLFVNLLIGCTNHLTRTEQLARYREEEARAAEPVSAPAVLPFPASAAADERARLLSDLDEARREIREAERREGAERVLELIVERAMKLTGASGAALGLFTEGRVVCRGRAGDPAPPLGSEVDVRQGLSGECVRSGQVVLCEDTQDDPRADAELCRSLGIGSLLAVPIMAESGATGLLEIFSPQARSFTKESGGVLERLAELVPNAEMEVAVAGDHIATGALVGTPAAPAGETATAPAIAEASDSGALQTVSSGKGSSLADLPRADIRRENLAAPDAAKAEAPAGLGTTAGEFETAHEGPTVLDNLRGALWDRTADLGRETQTEGETQEGLEAAEGARTHWYHVGLILSSVAVVALALGYLLAPTIERHLGGGVTAKQNPQVVSASAHAADTSRARALTPEELRKLADDGNAEAQFTLGTLYRNGDGVAQNDRQAVEWFQRSAVQGYVQAQRALGSCYWGGRGVQQDYAKAYFWYQLALALGDENSKSVLEGLSTQMTREQVVNVQQQAEAWLHAHNQTAKSSN